MSYDKDTLHNILNSFLLFEKTNNLFDVTIKKIKIWGFIRKDFFNMMSYDKLNLSSHNCINALHKKQFIYPFFWKHFNRYILSSQKQNIDILFLDHPRRVLDGKNYTCLYTDLVAKKLNKEYKCLTIEEPFWHEFPSHSISHFQQIPTENIYYTDFLEYSFRMKKLLFKIFRTRLYLEITNFAKDIINIAEKGFNLPFSNIESKIIDKILYVILCKEKCEKLLTKISPKIIMEFYCPALFRNLITYIANERNIPVVDIQHGIVGGYEDILYKFYEKDKYKPLPDYIFTFGEKLFNKEYNPFRNPKDHIIPIGFPYLEQQVKKKKNNLKKKYILVLSQWIVSKDIKKFVLELSNLIQNDSSYHIICKLHPYESALLYNDLKQKNVTIISSNSHNLYYYMKKSYIQVGVYSTAIYEGIAFGLPTFILAKLYGAEDTKTILGQAQGIYYINTANDLYKKIQSTSLKKPVQKNIDLLWKFDSIKSMKKQIDLLCVPSRKDLYEI